MPHPVSNPLIDRRVFLRGLSAAAAASCLPAAPTRPPNVILLLADDMGYGDLACYGHPTTRTPHLDRLAAEGLRLTSYYAAAPVCTPSRVGLLTGRYALRAGLPGNTGPETVGGLPLSEVTLAQVLKGRGYKTAMAGKWHLGHQPEAQLPTRRGFDSFLGLPYSNDMIRPWVQTDKPLHLYRGVDPVERVGDQSGLTARYTEEARRVIQAAGNHPFFLYLPYAMPHLPISASARFRGQSRTGPYGDVVEELDWSVGEILRTLQERGLEKDTLVIFTSDNGPWLDLPARMLQQGNEPWHTGSKGLLRGAKGTTWEGGLRVPCLARWPGRIPAGRTSAEIACALDLFVTIAKLAGAELPADRTYDGLNLLSHLEGRAPSPRNEFFYFLNRRVEAVREGPWKLRHTGTPELFHLDRDPAEQYNVYAQQRETGDRLVARLRAFAAELKAEAAA